jgi:hypothetical protein
VSPAAKTKEEMFDWNSITGKVCTVKTDLQNTTKSMTVAYKLKHTCWPTKSTTEP